MQYSNPKKTPSLVELFSLQGKNALVVGGAGLLGREIVFSLAELGANIIVASRDYEKCAALVTELQADFPNLRFSAHEIDICCSSSIQKAMKFVDTTYQGKLDILVNAGWSGKKNNFESITDHDWNLDIEVCLNGVFRTIKAASHFLKAEGGCILNIASMYGHVAPDYRLYDGEHLANPPSYGAAKAGIIQLTKYLASFLASHRIRVNCISPGPFPFEKTQQENPEFVKKLCAKNPLNRLGKPYEIKGVAALLCSDAASYITGQNFCVDGGWGIW